MSKKILVSPGFGAGWSTWNSGEPAKYMLTYQPIIDFIEKGGHFTNEDCHDNHGKGNIHPLLKQLQEEVKLKFNQEYICVLGADDLVVTTVHGPYRIREYDGSEHVEYKNEVEWDE